MSGHSAPRVGLPTRFGSALEKIQRLLAGALWDAKANSCGEAWSEIKKLKSANRKNEVIDAKAHQWREKSAKAIRIWLPKFVQLADAYSEALDRDILDWCRDEVWKRIETQCRIRKPNIGQLPRDTFSRSVEWWLAVASAGNWGVHLPESKPWKPPRWLARDGKETASLLRNHTRHLGMRLDHVITEELDLAEIQRVSSRRSGLLLFEETVGVLEPTAQLREPTDPANEAHLEAIVRKVRNPQAHTVLSIPEAALYFRVTARTIHRWNDQGKLKSGGRRGSITIQSIRQWEDRRSRKRRAR